MMKLVDSHCHLNMLDLSAYDGNLSALIQQAESVGVEHMLCVSVDLHTVSEVIEIACQHNNVSASVGLHPNGDADIEPSEDQLLQLAQQESVVAIGETGLDYHYGDADNDVMRERFRRHIRVAKQCQKPLIIHSRDARQDTIEIMRDEKADEIGGVMHCFTEDWAMAKKALDLGFFISFSGIVTFNNAREVAQVAMRVPMDRMLIETDAPYLTPVPYRGKKPNEPQYVRFVAQRIAQLRDLPIDQVAHQTTDNFYQFIK